MKPSTRLQKLLEQVVVNVPNNCYRCKLCDASIPLVPFPMEAEAWIEASRARCLGHVVEHFIEEERAKI